MEKSRKHKAPALQRMAFTPRACGVLGGVIFCVCAAFIFLTSGMFSPAKAYVGCPGYPDGVIGIIEENTVSFANTSSECRQIGIAVYRLYSATAREGAFYYFNTTALHSGLSRSYTFKPPLCSYVIDVIVGDPIKDVKSKADYGSRLLEERVFTTSLGYCTPSGSGIASDNSNPLPSPRNVPLPSPKIAAAPLPKPKVLGASATPTSTNPLAANTGSDAALPLALLASILASGAAVLVNPIRSRGRSFFMKSKPFRE
ncbi:MAG: hypothetical protein Q7S09_01490 [bacterium]|nr:hypothetical protein [bacterium]